MGTHSLVPQKSQEEELALRRLCCALCLVCRVSVGITHQVPAGVDSALVLRDSSEQWLLCQPSKEPALKSCLVTSKADVHLCLSLSVSLSHPKKKKGTMT